MNLFPPIAIIIGGIFVLVTNHGGWWAGFAWLGIVAICAIPVAIHYFWPEGKTETVVPAIREFIMMIRDSALSEEQKKRIRLKAIPDLPGAYADFMWALENPLPTIREFVGMVRASSLSDVEKRELLVRAIPDLPGAYVSYLDKQQRRA